MSDITQRNPRLSITEKNWNLNDVTAKNPFSQNDVTVRNVGAMNGAALPIGTILLDKYRIIKRISNFSGEATIYLCGFKGKPFAAKVCYVYNPT